MSATKTRIMYIEHGWRPGRIGRVRVSKTRHTLFYGRLELQSLKGRGYKANYIDVESGTRYWISGPRKDGQDTLYPGLVEIDDDVREEYWRDLRGQATATARSSFHSLGAHAKHATR